MTAYKLQKSFEMGNFGLNSAAKGALGVMQGSRHGSPFVWEGGFPPGGSHEPPPPPFPQSESPSTHVGVGLYFHMLLPTAPDAPPKVRKSGFKFQVPSGGASQGLSRPGGPCRELLSNGCMPTKVSETAPHIPL